jgi:hypothetical protein
MEWAGHRACINEKKCIKNFGQITSGKEISWGNLDVDGRIILR